MRFSLLHLSKFDDAKLLSREHRTNFAAYINQLLDFYETYHARKENTIWAATTLYLAGVVTLLSSVSSFFARLPLWGSTSASFALVALMYLTLKFSQRHYESRDFATAMTSACGIVIANLLDPGYQYTYADLKPMPQQSDITRENYIWPAALAQRLDVPFKDTRWNWDKIATRSSIVVSTVTFAAIGIWSSQLPFPPPPQLVSNWQLALIAPIDIGVLAAAAVTVIGWLLKRSQTSPSS